MGTWKVFHGRGTLRARGEEVCAWMPALWKCWPSKFAVPTAVSVRYGHLRRLENRGMGCNCFYVFEHIYVTLVESSVYTSAWTSMVALRCLGRATSVEWMIYTPCGHGVSLTGEALFHSSR